MIKSDPDQTAYATMSSSSGQQTQLHGRDQLKRKLTLNIGSANANNLASSPSTKSGSGSPSVIKRTRAQNRLEVLSTPDLLSFKLGSPEIERLILSQTNNLQTPTPISQYFLNNASPKNVSQEQEMYVKGFQEALTKLHQQNAGVQSSGADSVSSHDTNNNTDWSSTCSDDSSSMQQAPPPTTVTTRRGAARKNTTTSRASNARGGAAARRQNSTASSTSGGGNSTDKSAALLNPIDMGSQEKIKLERKRQRNRVAASKCRKRKLERIAKLEVKVNHLKVENVELNNMAGKLRDSVSKLKAEIEHHRSMGCNFDHLNNLLQ